MMVAERFDGRRTLAGRARLAAAELVLPVFAILALTLVLRREHWAERVVMGAAIVAVALGGLMGAGRALRTADRARRSDEALVIAADAVDAADVAGTAILAVIAEQVAGPLARMSATAAEMAADRRLSPSVRGRLMDMRAAAEGALAALDGVRDPAVETPAPAKAPRTEPPMVVAPIDFTPLQVTRTTVFEPHAEPEAPPAFQPARPLRVLAAEPNGVHQLVLRTHLAPAGVEPEFVTDGPALLEAWRREPWDLILMDLHLPRIEAVAAVRTIRLAEARTGWPFTPIVVLGADPASAEAADCLAAGASACVAKPMAAQGLLAAIEAALRDEPPGDRLVEVA